MIEQNGRQDATLQNTRSDIEGLGEIVIDADSRSGGAIKGLDQGNDFDRTTIEFHYSPQGLTLDGIERSGEVNKADGRRLLEVMARFQNVPQSEYLVHASTPNSESGLVEPRPRITYGLKPFENLHSNVDEAYAAVVLTLCLISLLEDRQEDARSPVFRN